MKQIKLPIKSRKDWLIAFAVAFVTIYYITVYNNFKIEKFMMRFSPDKMNLMNYPGGWGNLMVVAIIMTVLVVIVMMILKSSIKRILLVTATGIAFSVLMLIGFVVHTNLIVGTNKEYDASHISISCFDNTVNINSSAEDPQIKELIQKAVALKSGTKSEQEAMRVMADDRKDSIYNIWISYPKKYGQTYDFILYVQDNVIYSNHGDGTAGSRIYYKDNGFIEVLQKLIDENRNSKPIN